MYLNLINHTFFISIHSGPKMYAIVNNCIHFGSQSQDNKHFKASLLFLSALKNCKINVKLNNQNWTVRNSTYKNMSK